MVFQGLVTAWGEAQRRSLPWVEDRFPGGLFRLPSSMAPGVILTIDDGLSSRTGELLELLARYGAKATFFLHTDSFADPDAAALVAGMLQAGHTIGNHMPQDVHSHRLSPATFAQEFHRADVALRRLGVVPQYFRAAGGLYYPAMVSVLRQYGYWPQCIMASFLPWDTHLPWPVAYAQMMVAAAFPGAIAVFHDGEQQGAGRLQRTMIGLEYFLQGMAQRGLPVLALPPAPLQPAPAPPVQGNWPAPPEG